MTGEAAKRLPIVYAPAALADLDAIWDWTEQAFGRKQAAEYIEFLTRHIDTLSVDPTRGRLIHARPGLRWLLLKFKSRGHGHVAVYSVDEHRVKVLHIFHSSQHWETKLAGRTES